MEERVAQRNPNQIEEEKDVEYLEVGIGRGGTRFILLSTLENPSVETRFTLDTGSALNIMPIGEARRIGVKNIDLSDQMILVGVSDERMKTIGSCSVTFTVGKFKCPVTFHLVDKLICPGLMGLDFMDEYVLNLDIRDHFITVQPMTYDDQLEKEEQGAKDGDKPALVGIAFPKHKLEEEEKRIRNKTYPVLDGVPAVKKEPKEEILAEEDEEEEEELEEEREEHMGEYNLDNGMDYDLVEYRNHRKLQGVERERLLVETMKLESIDQGTKNVFRKHKDIFFLDGDEFTKTRAAVHEIETTSNVPINKRQYRFPEVTKKHLKEQIDEMLTLGIIKHSTSPWNAPVLCIPKKDDEEGNKRYRIVVDFRALNEITKPFVYPIPLINELFDTLDESQFFSTLDLKSGFYQIPIHARDAAKTAFSTPNGHYEFTRMPMGLKNSPSTFQRLMNTVLYEIKGVRAVVYLDDIIIYGRTIQEHNEHLEKVLNGLRKHNLRLEPKKCQILKKEIKYLGHIIDRHGIRPARDNVRSIEEMKRPTTVKEVRSFLGAVTFYGKFIPGIAKTRKPLNDLLKKEARFVWTEDCQKAFDSLRKALISEPLLVRPNHQDTFVLTTDASQYAIGAVLSNAQTMDKPIAFASRSLVGAETRYHTIEKELLAIVWATAYFGHYIFGQKFIVYTDHRPLVSIWRLKENSPVLTRLRLKLQGLECEIRYKQGKENLVADFLSRMNNTETEEKGNVKNDHVAGIVTRQQKKLQDAAADPADRKVTRQKKRQEAKTSATEQKVARKKELPKSKIPRPIKEKEVASSKIPRIMTRQQKKVQKDSGNQPTAESVPLVTNDPHVNGLMNLDPDEDDAETGELLLARQLYTEFSKCQAEGKLKVDQLQISTMKGLNKDIPRIVILNNRTAHKELATLWDVPQSVKDLMEGEVIVILEGKIYGVILEGKTNSFFKGEILIGKLFKAIQTCLEKEKREDRLQIIMFREPKQIEILQIMLFLESKFGIPLVISNATDEPMGISGQEIDTVLREFHDAPLGGHVGAKRMRKRIGKIYQWPSMKKDIENYVRKCDSCQKNKICRYTKIPMKITTTSSEPFEKIFMDIVVLPESDLGNKYGLVIQDDLSRFIIVAAMENQEANTVAKTFVENMICHFGTPKELVTDQGTNFMSRVIKNVCKTLKIKKINTSAYHPQANLVERANREFKMYLRQFIGGNPRIWDQQIPCFCFEYNTTVNSSTGYTPFELIYGRKPRIPTSVYQSSQTEPNYDDYVQNMRNQFSHLHALAKENLIKSKENRKEQYDKGTKEWQPMWGEQVLVQSNPTGAGQKLQSNWRGPYLVVDLPSEQTTIIKNGNKFEKIHNNRLKKYHE